MQNILFRIVIFLSVFFNSFAVGDEADSPIVEEEIKKVPFKPITLADNKHVHFFESFHLKAKSDDEKQVFDQLGWVLSTEDEYSKQETFITEVDGGFEGDNVLVLRKKHVRYGISKKLAHPVDLDSEQITFQFEARFGNKLTCSGAYLKFVSESSVAQVSFSEKTPYVLMFGPDRCSGKSKLHVIFRHENPISKEFEEKHMVHEGTFPNDEFSHTYTLQIKKSDQSVRILVDREEVALKHVTEPGEFSPNFIPDEEIFDPEDKKPLDWEDDKMIPDPEAKKPEDWVDEELIADPASQKPEDWNDEEDGVWEPPMVPNPDYTGVWEPPMIENAKYVGEWEPRKIKNPNFFTQDYPLSNLPKITHVFVEVLANDANISFDNILIASDYETGKIVAETQGLEKQKLEKKEHDLKKKKQQKEEREKNLEEDFGIVSLFNYAYGEAYDHVMRYPVLYPIVATVAVLSALYYAIRVPGSAHTFSVDVPDLAEDAEEEEEEKESEAKHKKDDDNEVEDDDGDENESTENIKEKSEKTKVRRRPRRAD